MAVEFSKMHGLGNDMVIVDDRCEVIGANKNRERGFALSILDRHTGVGADSLLLIRNSDKADIKMLIYNIDGTEAEMCGNGLRCFVKYVIESGIICAPSFTVETLSGIKRPTAFIKNGIVTAIGADMGEPLLDCESIPVAADGVFQNRIIFSHGVEFKVTALNVGVPHAVAFVRDVETLDVAHYGRDIERMPLFPKRINVDFVQVVDNENIILRSWERGCGVTLCCGTGACASVVACALSGHTGRRVNVHVELGTLIIEWREDNSIYMQGPAQTVCEGMFNYIPD